MTDAPRTASIYLRLSSPDEDDRTGFETQEAECRALAARFGVTVVAVHKDDGFSGVLRQRPGFLAWLDDGRTGRADLLLAWKSDRVSRGGLAGVAPLVDLVNGIDSATGLPARGRPRPRLLTCADAVDSSVIGWEAIFGIHASTAKGERDATSARMLAHRAANRAAGRAVGGRRPWAFQTVPNPDGPGSVRRPIPAHADAIRAAYDTLRDGGSLGAVVRDWTARGLVPKGSRKARERAEADGQAYVQAWTTGGIRRILENPNLYGATTHGGALLRNPDGTVRVDPAQAILSLTEWTDLQRLLAGRATRRDAPTDEPALLAGLLTCASCGRAMYPHRPTGGRTHTYRCRGGQLCPRPTSVAMADAEEFLVDAFRQLLGDRPYAPPRPRAPRPNEDEILAVREALRTVEAALEDDLDDSDALALLRRRKDLRARLAALQDALQLADAEPTTTARTYAEAFDDAPTVRDRNRLIGFAFDRIEVTPGTRGGARHFDPTRFRFGGDLVDYAG